MGTSRCSMHPCMCSCMYSCMFATCMHPYIALHYMTLHHIPLHYIALHYITMQHIHTYKRTYVHAYTHACIHKYIHTYIHTCMHTYIHTHIHTYTHTHMHTCTHCIHWPSLCLCVRAFGPPVCLSEIACYRLRLQLSFNIGSVTAVMRQGAFVIWMVCDPQKETIKKADCSHAEGFTNIAHLLGKRTQWQGVPAPHSRVGDVNGTRRHMFSLREDAKHHMI